MKRWMCLLAVPLAITPIPAQFAVAQGQPTPAATPAPAPPAATPAATPEPAAPAYSQAELEQILAPIALYPDDLLTQVLVASTYPLEIVTASRWLKQPANKALKGDDLIKALDSEDWDASVKSLVPFPDVLNTMSEKLDWTQKLGDAFLAQQADVLAAVQSLRARAQTAGKLQSNPQQTVTQQGPAIVIQPAQPSTVYVPVYNPSVVYGTWPYPANPPVYYPPPVGYNVGAALATGLAFGAGVAVTAALWGWGSPNWGRGNVDVNVNRYNNINSNRQNNFSPNRGAITSGTWQHDPAHRRGVAYNNPRVSQTYRPNQAARANQRDAFRGRQASPPALAQNGQRPNAGANRPQAAHGGGNLQGRAQNAHPGNRNPPNRVGGGGHQNGPRPNPGGGQQGRQPPRARPPSNSGGAFRGIDRGGDAARAQSARGHASLGGAGGGRRPGGGGRGGGGGGHQFGGHGGGGRGHRGR